MMILKIIADCILMRSWDEKVETGHTFVHVVSQNLQRLCVTAYKKSITNIL